MCRFLCDVGFVFGLLSVALCVPSLAQQTRLVNVAGNPPQGSGTNGALQFFDSVQSANGQCASFANNQTCALTIVEAGDTVNWVYRDPALALHSATAGPCTSTCTATGPFDSKVFTSTLRCVR